MRISDRIVDIFNSLPLNMTPLTRTQEDELLNLATDTDSLESEVKILKSKLETEISQMRNHLLSPKEKIQMLSKLIKNHTLAEPAIKDLEKIVPQEKDFYVVANDLITYDRNRDSSELPPGMNKQKYHVAGEDVWEVRISQKYRFYIKNKLVIRIDLKHKHNLISNWFNNTTKY